MSRESHRRYLERAALREAQKAMRRPGDRPFSREDFSRLRIQTVEPWKRFLLGLIALGLAGLGINAWLNAPIAVAWILFALAAGVLLFAIFGRKRKIDTTLDSIDLSGIIVTVFDSLTP